MLSVMMGNPAEEYPLLTLDFVPECGHIYDLDLVANPDGGWLLVPSTVKPSREYFENVDHSLQLNDVVAEIGQPDSFSGSGITTYHWFLEDGSEVLVVFEINGIGSIIISSEGTEPEILYFR